MKADYILTLEERGNGFDSVEPEAFAYCPLTRRMFLIVNLERDGHIEPATRPGGSDTMRVGAVASLATPEEVEVVDARLRNWRPIEFAGARGQEASR